MFVCSCMQVWLSLFHEHCYKHMHSRARTHVVIKTIGCLYFINILHAHAGGYVLVHSECTAFWCHAHIGTPQPQRFALSFWLKRSRAESAHGVLRKTQEGQRSTQNGAFNPHPMHVQSAIVHSISNFSVKHERM